MPPNPPKGIISPWAVRPVAEPVVVSQQGEDGFEKYDGAKRLFITLDGQVSKLHLPYIPDAKREALKDALMEMEEVLKKLQNIKGFTTLLNEHSISLTPPLAPKVTLTFGAMKLYAVASSRVADIATKMAIDRLCTALRSARAKFPTARTILDRHGVKISVR